MEFVEGVNRRSPLLCGSITQRLVVGGCPKNIPYVGAVVSGLCNCSSGSSRVPSGSDGSARGTFPGKEVPF